MNELERRRLEKQNEWTPLQVLEACQLDYHNGKIDFYEPGGTLVKISIMCTVETPGGRLRLVTYQAGYDNMPEHMGYLDMFKAKLVRWWEGGRP